MKRRGRAVVVLLAALLLAVGLFLLGQFPHEPVRRFIEARLRQGVGGAGSRLGCVRIVPGRRQIELCDLVIERETFRLEVPRAFVVAKMDFVLGRSLSFEIVQLESPKLLLRPSDEPSEKRPLLREALVIDHAEIIGGLITYAAQGRGDLVLQGVDARGSVGKNTLEVALDGGSWQGERRLALGAGHGLLRVSSALDVTIDALDLSTARSSLHASGRLGILGMLEPDLQIDSRLDLRDVNVLQLQPEMAGTVALKGRVKHTDRLLVDAFVEGERLRIATWPVDRLAGSVKHGQEEADRTRLHLEASLLGGQAEARLALRGTRTDGRVSLAGIDIDRLRRQGLDLGFPDQGRVSGTVDGSGDLRGTLAVRSTFDVSGRGAGLRLDAHGSASGDVQARARHVDLDWRLSVEATPASRSGALARLSKADLTARGRAAGALPPAIDSRFEGVVTMLGERGAERVPVSGHLRYRDAVLSAEATATGLGGATEVSLEQRGGVVRRLVANARGLDVAFLVPDTQGTLDAEVSAQGTWAALSGTGSAHVHGLVWREVVVGETTARLSAQNGLAQVGFAAPQLNATGEGTLSARARTFRGTLRLADTPLAPLQPLLAPDRPLQGVVTGTVEVDLPFERPQALVLVARLQRAEIEQGTLYARARRPFTLTLRGRQVQVEGLEAEGPGVDVAADGSLSLAPQGRLDLRLRGQADLARLPAPPGWTMQGLAAGEVHLTGTRVRPRAHGLVGLRDAILQRLGAAPIQVAGGDVLLEGEAAVARGLRVTMAHSSLELSGRIPLTAVLGEELAARLDLADTPPSELVARLDVALSDLPLPAPWTLTGRLQGEALLFGTRTRPRATGELTLHEAVLYRYGVPAATVGRGSLLLAEDAVEIPGLAVDVAAGTAVLSGRVPLAALLGQRRAEGFSLATGSASLRLAWQDIEAAALVETLRPDAPSPLRGTLFGEASVEGQFTGWQNLRGRVEMPSTALTVEGEPLQIEPFVMELAGGRVTTSGLRLAVHDTRFSATGEADLVQRTVQAHGEGHLELRALSPLVEDFSLGGHAEVNVELTGPLWAPQPTGTVVIEEGVLRVRDMPIVLTEIKARLLLERTAMRVQEATALLGGGTLTMAGEGRLDGLRLADLRLGITGRDVSLRYPVGGRYGKPIWEELKARVDADLTLSGRPGDFLLAGTVNAERALYDADMFLEEAFLPPRVPPDAGEPSRFRRSVALNITMVMENPLVVRNNLAELQAEGTLSLRGDLQDLAPFGRLEIHPGGKVLLQGREFTITSGTLIYQGTMDPEIHVVAQTVIAQTTGDVEVTISASGQLAQPRLTLSSSPPLSEREIASLIVTGRPDVTLDTSTVVLGRHAASLLAGRFTRQVARELMQLGFDQVDIQPELLAREGDPRARFVFAKQVNRRLRLVYGVGLNDPEARYYQALFRFRPGTEITLKAQREETGSYTYSAGQRVRLGSGGRRQRFEEEKTRLKEVDFPNETPVPETVLLSWVHARPGKKVTYWDLVDDADRIQDRLVDMGYIEALADAHLHEEVAHFHVRTGPRYRWRVDNMERPPDLSKEVKQALYEEEALERGRERLLSELRKRGHLRAEVKTRAVTEDGGRTLLFEAQPGPPLTVAEARFPGATVFPAGRLLKEAGGVAIMMADPRQAQERLRLLYREHHYLTTKVKTPQVVEEAGQVYVVMEVDEGPRARLIEVRLEGSSLPPQELSPLMHIEAGDEYDPLQAAETVLRLRERYLELGYPAVRVSTSLVPRESDLELVFRVVEGPRVVVGDIVIKGLKRTRESLVRRQINVKKGDLLDPRDLATLERRILELGIFSRAVVTAGEGSPATVAIEVEEQPRFLVAYDVRYNQDEGGSGLLDAEMGNLFGRGWTIGGRHRRGRGLDESRASFHVPSVFRGGDLTLSVFRLRDDEITARELRAAEFGLPVEGGRLREQGFQVQQALHFLHPWEALYGYRYRCVSTRAPLAAEFTTQDVGGLDLALARDSRDTALAATRRGSFLSVSLEVAPKVLGSDFDFVKGFAQYSMALPLNRSVSWAQGYRLGVGKPFGAERMVAFERFKAGGANSVRGYASDSLGPRDELGQPGGDAVIVVNQELRYQHPIGLGAAVFYDTGNVFRSLSDLGLELRHAVGVGLRYDSPIGLLRFDVGLPLGRRAGEETYQLWFGLGQAF